MISPIRNSVQTSIQKSEASELVIRPSTQSKCHKLKIIARLSDAQDVEEQQERLRKALTLYQQRTVGTKAYIKLDVDSTTCTWEDVLETVNTAALQYDQPNGAWGKIRKSLRKFGRNNQAFSAWTELLPSQSEYVSLLCGGFKLIIGVRVFHRFWEFFFEELTP
jgi:hypothetical protein